MRVDGGHLLLLKDALVVVFSTAVQSRRANRNSATIAFTVRTEVTFGTEHNRTEQNRIKQKTKRRKEKKREQNETIQIRKVTLIWRLNGTGMVYLQGKIIICHGNNAMDYAIIRVER